MVAVAKEVHAVTRNRCLDQQEDVRFRALRLIGAHPTINQRALAQALNLSLGRTNYCVQALLEKGFIQIQRFQDSPRKRAYLYLLTPAGMAHKAEITLRFLQRKMAEYDRLREEIESLRVELGETAVIKMEEVAS